MIRIERSENLFPRRVMVYANEGNLERQMITGYCYPEYDNWIRLKLNCAGLGFQLSIEQAEHLRDVLDCMIKESK